MTFNIKSLLQNGKSADEIASLFTKELNAAVAENEKEDKKFNDFLSVYTQVVEFCNTYYPTNVKKENENLEKDAKNALKFLETLFAPKEKEKEKNLFTNFFINGLF